MVRGKAATDLTPPAPLSSSALLRNAAWRGGSEKRSSFWLPLSTSGIAAKLERGLGGEVGRSVGGVRSAIYPMRTARSIFLAATPPQVSSAATSSFRDPSATPKRMPLFSPRPLRATKAHAAFFVATPPRHESACRFLVAKRSTPRDTPSIAIRRPLAYAFHASISSRRPLAAARCAIARVTSKPRRTFRDRFAPRRRPLREESSSLRRSPYTSPHEIAPRSVLADASPPTFASSYAL